MIYKSQISHFFTSPKDGYTFVAGDYSQLELRIIAGMSKDRELIEAFKSGRDPFREVGQKWFAKKEINDEERNQVKRALYGKTKKFSLRLRLSKYYLTYS